MVECPYCRIICSLTLHRDILCFKLHGKLNKSKTKSQLATKRWVRRAIDVFVVDAFVKNDMLNGCSRLLQGHDLASHRAHRNGEIQPLAALRRPDPRSNDQMIAGDFFPLAC